MKLTGYLLCAATAGVVWLGVVATDPSSSIRKEYRDLKRAVVRNYVPVQVPAEARGGVVLLGDSMLSLSPKDFLPGTGAVNLARSGATSADVLARAKAVAKHRPAVVVLIAGINDIQGRRDPAETQANLQRIVGTLRDAGARVVVMQYVPVNTDMYERVIRPMHPHVHRPPTECVERLNQMIDALPCEKVRVSELLGVAQLSPEFTDDGLHFNAAAYARMRGEILAAVTSPQLPAAQHPQASSPTLDALEPTLGLPR